MLCGADSHAKLALDRVTLSSITRGPERGSPESQDTALSPISHRMLSGEGGSGERFVLNGKVVVHPSPNFYFLLQRNEAT